MISHAVSEKQHGPPLVLNLLWLSLSPSLADFRPPSLSLYHSYRLLVPPPPSLPAWAFGLIWNPGDKGLFQSRQSGHNASVSAQAPSICLPHTHSHPEVPLEGCHYLLYMEQFTLQPLLSSQLELAGAHGAASGCFYLGMAPAERPSCRPPVQHQLHQSSKSDVQETWYSLFFSTLW